MSQVCAKLSSGTGLWLSSTVPFVKAFIWSDNILSVVGLGFQFSDFGFGPRFATKQKLFNLVISGYGDALAALNPQRVLYDRKLFSSTDEERFLNADLLTVHLIIRRSAAGAETSRPINATQIILSPLAELGRSSGRTSA